MVANNGSLTLGQVIMNILPEGTLAYLDSEDASSLEFDETDSDGEDDFSYWDEPPVWPTDLFVTAAHIIQSSGLLTYFDPDPNFKHHHPLNPISFTLLPEERRACAEAGREWAINSEVPTLVYTLWKKVTRAWEEPVRASTYAQKRRRKNPPIWWTSVVQLVVLADEACVGLGAPPVDEHPKRWLVDWFQENYAKPFKKAYRISDVGYRGARQPTTFGWLSDPDVACVQPKNRTATVGCNLRNLTRNMAYVPHAGNVRCHWQQPVLSTLVEDADRLDILIIPLPLQMEADWVAPNPKVTPSADRPNWGNFEIKQGWLDDEDAVCNFAAAELQKAQQLVADKSINAVIFPEYALTEALFHKVCERLKTIEPKLEFAISGSSTNCDGEHGNFVLTALWYQTGRETEVSTASRYLLTSRRKHHRWKLTGKQIEDYNLQTSLDPMVSWWETHTIAQREIHFFHFRKTSTFTSMICEDLARSDPCHDIVRSIGPNLLFALLMDGPQKQNRWPARYASTLADDPGTAVLTVTSMGLINRTNDLKKYPHTTVIAMWRDETGLVQELPLEKDSRSLVLTIKAETVIDQTLDGRSNPNARTWRYESYASVPADIKLD